MADTALILFDSYDPLRIPARPLPIPEGVRPARITTTPVVSELIVELVVAGQGIAVLPGWVAAPYRERGRVATVRMGRTPRIQTWCVAWRKDDEREHVAAFVDILRGHFADGDAPVAA